MRDDRQPNAFARPARLGDRLVTTQFIHNRGFAAANDPDAEVCIALGTELAFDQHIECEPMSVRATATACGPSQTMATVGPEVTNSTSEL